MKTFEPIKEFLIENKWKYFWGIVALIFIDVLQLITPRIIGTITDMFSTNQLFMKDIYIYIVYILIIALSLMVFKYIFRLLIFGTSRELIYWFRNKLFFHLETLSPSFYNNNKTGDLMAHATNDINAVRLAFGAGISMIVDAFILIISIVAIMIFTIDVKLTIVAIMPLPVIAIVMLIVKRNSMLKNKEIKEAFSNITDKVQENISGIKVIKSYSQEENEAIKFSNANQEYFNKNMAYIKFWGAMFPLISFISMLSFLISLGYGGTKVIDNEISIGQFVSFVTYLGLLTWPMMAAGWVVNMLQRGVTSMNRINVILNTKPEIFDSKDVLEMQKEDLIPEIEFKNLSFTYPKAQSPTLVNINLKVKKGKTLAIIGRTGSGKTTLVNLILRMYNSVNDSLFVGGNAINKIPLKVLRGNIGYVPQDSFLFSVPIKENIAFSDSSMDFNTIVEAAKTAEVYDNIMEFPEKFDTLVGERGVTLSGGQKQRISIARAIVKDPKILILDDSLSAVDTKTEEKILQSLKKLTKNKTCILISHRISTIKHADEIIVLEEGKIVERGTHDNLIETEGIYNNIYQKQLLEEKLQNKL